MGNDVLREGLVINQQDRALAGIIFDHCRCLVYGYNVKCCRKLSNDFTTFLPNGRARTQQFSRTFYRKTKRAAFVTRPFGILAPRPGL
ncbi:MAG: hypothetical protein ACXWC4_24995, partial [Telluria sp.]